MASTTPVFAWPVPVGTDDPDIHTDMTNLGLAIESTVNTLKGRVDGIDNATPVENQQDTSGTTTSTTYTATLTGGSACQGSFVAPPSGAVFIMNNARHFCSVTGITVASVRIGTGATPGAGSVTLAASDAHATVNQNNVNAERMGVGKLLTGLTPGSTYNYQQQYRTSTGTGTFLDKSVQIIPCL